MRARFTPLAAGAVIVETQQNSDTTYRLYDYGRPRELHIEHGLRATREQTHAGKVIAGKPQIEERQNAGQPDNLAVFHRRPIQVDARLGVPAAAARKTQRLVPGGNARMRRD